MLHIYLIATMYYKMQKLNKAALKYMLFWGTEFVNGCFVILIWN